MAVLKLSVAWSTFPWQQKLHKGVFPSQAGKALLLFQWHTKWVRQGRADSSLLLLLQLWVSFHLHTHRQSNDTTENETERERRKCREATFEKENKKEEINLSVTIRFICRAAEQQDSRSYSSDACCFPRKPPAAANHHSVFLETKKWHVENMQCFCCKN